jgi:xanthine dehydrogenase accessory factor
MQNSKYQTEQGRDYLISILGKQGVIKRKLLSGKELNKIIQSNEADLLLRTLESSGCIVIESCDILSSDIESSSLTIIESINLGINLFVFGAGHVGQAVAHIGNLVGYNTLVLDDRDDFLNKVRENYINILKVDFNNLDLYFPANTAVVIVTRGHQFDELCLKYALGFDLLYVGMIGSKRRVNAIYRRLENQGVIYDWGTRVYSPIGIKIGAITPVEIAVSIISEIISVMNKSSREKYGI